MLQLKKQPHTPRDRTEPTTHPYQQSRTSEVELSAVLQQFAGRERQLRQTIADLQQENQDLKEAATNSETNRHEFERSRHLLSIKEQLIIAQQREIAELKASLQKPRSSTNKLQTIKGAPELELSDLSKIDSLESSSEKENRGFDTKRKICLKKSTLGRGVGGVGRSSGLEQEGLQLQVARLRAETGRLQGTIEALQTQLLIAQIQTEHLSTEYEAASRRERRLYDSFLRFLREGGEEGALSQKCELLERCIDKLTERVERIDAPRRAQEPPLPPVTPHFSSGTAFVFPAARRTPNKHHSPPNDEIFECCEQDPSDSTD